ncbi:MAG: hypothetical protein PHR65_02555 [Syntrophomonadaceae bacterium]|nr:hypothetical protein [Syntrophomonadaceae bacterium]
MDCQDINNKIYEYCDDLASSSPSHLEILSHLRDCETCQQDYQLTLVENEILRDTSDIPDLSPAFTTMVMGALNLGGDLNGQSQNPPKESGITSVYYRKIWLGGGLALAAAVIALCLYIPHLSQLDSEIEVADTYGSVSYEQPVQDVIVKQDSEPSPIDQFDPPTIRKTEQKESTANKSNYKVKSTPTQRDTSRPPSIASAAVSRNQGEQFTIKDKNIALGADNRDLASIYMDSSPENDSDLLKSTSIMYAGNKSSDSINVALSPLNMPQRFKLIQYFNSEDNWNIYDYASLDGKESVHLTVTPYIEPTIVAKTLNISTQENIATLTRDIQVGGQKFTVTYTGDLSTDDLTALADIVRFAGEVK